MDETLSGKRPIEALPGQFHYGLDAVCEAVSDCLAAGVTHCILFGLPREKDAVGSSAWAKHGVVQEAIRAIKAKYPNFYVITDVCMCEYTDHGHCGILCGQSVDNDKTLEVLAKTALSHVEAGADMVALVKPYFTSTERGTSFLFQGYLMYRQAGKNHASCLTSLDADLTEVMLENDTAYTRIRFQCHLDDFGFSIRIGAEIGNP